MSKGMKATAPGVRMGPLAGMLPIVTTAMSREAAKSRTRVTSKNVINNTRRATPSFAGSYAEQRSRNACIPFLSALVGT